MSTCRGVAGIAVAAVLVVGGARHNERSITSRAGLPFAAIPGGVRASTRRDASSSVNLLRGTMAARAFSAEMG